MRSGAEAEIRDNLKHWTLISGPMQDVQVHILFWVFVSWEEPGHKSISHPRQKSLNIRIRN